MKKLITALILPLCFFFSTASFAAGPGDKEVGQTDGEQINQTKTSPNTESRTTYCGVNIGDIDIIVILPNGQNYPKVLFVSDKEMDKLRWAQAILMPRLHTTSEKATIGNCR